MNSIKKMKQVNVMIPHDLYESLEKIARENAISSRAMATLLLVRAIRDTESKGNGTGQREQGFRLAENGR